MERYPKRLCARSDKAMAVTTDLMREGCEKAEASNRRAGKARECGETAKAAARKANGERECSQRLAVTDDAEGIVMGQDLTKVCQNLVDWEWSCRVWVTRVDHVVALCGCRGALATAPLAPATPGHIPSISYSKKAKPDIQVIQLDLATHSILPIHPPYIYELFRRMRRVRLHETMLTKYSP